MIFDLQQIIAVWALSSACCYCSVARAATYEPRRVQMDPVIPLTQWRTINGTDRADHKGAAETPLMRMSQDMTYEDNMSEMWNNTNPRAISNALMKQDHSIPNKRNLLDMVWQWGQVSFKSDGCLSLMRHPALYINSTSH